MEWNTFFYTPCIREWQEDYPGGHSFLTNFSLYKPRSGHLILAIRGLGRFGGVEFFLFDQGLCFQS